MHDARTFGYSGIRTSRNKREIRLSRFRSLFDTSVSEVEVYAGFDRRHEQPRVARTGRGDARASLMGLLAVRAENLAIAFRLSTAERTAAVVWATAEFAGNKE